MAQEDIEQLIGAGFLPIKRRRQPPPPVYEPPDADRCRFISGPRSRFVTEHSMSVTMAHALAIHEEGVRRKAEKKAATLITLTVPVKRRTAFLRSLKGKTDALRSFMVDELAVFELALSTALDEMRDELEQLTGSTVEALTVARVQKAAESLVEMHAVNKLASTLGVSAEIRKLVLQMMGSPDGPKAKDMPNLSALRAMLQAGKVGTGEVRGMEAAGEAVVNGRRTHSGPGGVHATRGSGGRHADAGGRAVRGT